jgi:hypothetical protein
LYWFVDWLNLAAGGLNHCAGFFSFSQAIGLHTNTGQSIALDVKGRNSDAGGHPPGPLGGQIILGIFSDHLIT